MSKEPPAEQTQERPQRRDDADEAAEQVGTPVSASAEAAADELTATQRERDEYLELAQRTRADFENYRKRVAKEASDALARGKSELAQGLIPVVDNLERALEASSADPESLAKGVALVHEELRAKLESAGVEAYDPAGEAFDPELHEALSTRAEEGAKPGKVLETIDKGYRLDGQVLRPARVVVSE